MPSNFTFVHRSRRIGRSLARELSSIERNHAQNVATHQKLEDSIRRSNNETPNINRTKFPVSTDRVSNDQTDGIDHCNNINSCLKRRQSIGSSSTSTMSQNLTNFDQTDEIFDENIPSNMSCQRRRLCSKFQRLPPVIIKRSTSVQQKRSNKTQQSVTNLQQSNIFSKENLNESCSILNDELTKPDLSELPPIEKQVRTFLEKLPKYTDVQYGFDSFASSSLYSKRQPIRIR